MHVADGGIFRVAWLIENCFITKIVRLKPTTFVTINQHVKIKISPNVDTILILECIEPM